MLYWDEDESFRKWTNFKHVLSSRERVAYLRLKMVTTLVR